MTDRSLALSLFIIALVTLAIALPAAAKIYKWTDEQGNVHYGDEPPEGAEAVDLPPAPVYESPKRPQGSPRTGDRTARESANQGPAYERFAIAAPGDESTIRGAEQTITVRVAAEPRLRAGHTVTIQLDGEAVASGPRLQFSIGPVYRGAHTLTAVVRDASGKVIERSERVTFYKHQPSVN